MRLWGCFTNIVLLGTVAFSIWFGSAVYMRIRDQPTGYVNSQWVPVSPGRETLFCGVDQFGTPKRC